MMCIIAASKVIISNYELEKYLTKIFNVCSKIIHFHLFAKTLKKILHHKRKIILIYTITKFTKIKIVLNIVLHEESFIWYF